MWIRMCIIVLALLLQGCTRSTPSAKSAEEAFVAFIGGELRAKLRVSEFKKVDGQTRELFGTKLYLMDYSAAIDIDETMLLVVDKNDLRAARLPPPDHLQKSCKESGSFFGGAGFVCKGDRLFVSGQVEFTLKESGWLAENRYINQGSLIAQDADRRLVKSNAQQSGANPSTDAKVAEYLKSLEKQFGKPAPRPPLSEAIDMGDLEKARQILKSEVSQEDLAYSLHLAAMRGHVDLVESVLDKGVPINARDRNGRTALFASIVNSSRSIEAAKRLIKRGVDVNAQDTNGMTVLMEAAFSGNVALVELVLSNGANTALVSKDGKTAKDFAAQEGKSTVMAILFNHSHRK
ncbi:MAG: ankyrin repeat domain-containing protein [Betaproteobacteria bacterium]|nr:ankyrin repeat domain-containing protein [Betaproteobacteria bacterium]